MKKKTTKKAATDVKAKKQSGSASGRKVKRASKKILSAAAHIRKTTKKIVDDVFLKVVGLRVLERAQEITRSLPKEKTGKKGRK
ncbi:MAG: hypothetical protein ACXWC9_10720 [Pseudobdellovibrionaceae bacterium]